MTEEIINNAKAFRDRWKDYTGTEKAESQTFLNEFFAVFNLDRKQEGAKLEEIKYKTMQLRGE